MRRPSHPSERFAISPPWRIVLPAIVALAVAMGIGRFAFTPLLPLMLRDASLDAAAGAEWAAANYVGYLAGALTAARSGLGAVPGLRWAVAGIAVTTVAVAFVTPSTAVVGLLLRAAAGVFSAWALVFASSWGLGALSRLGATALGAWIYTGVGAGIAITGLIAWLGGAQPAWLLWLELGLLSAGGAVMLWRALDRVEPAPPPAPTTPRMPAAAPAPVAARRGLLVACYGCFGFGYIVPATFLPAMARERVADPLVFGLTWPLFGMAAALSVAAAAFWLARWPRRRVWALAQLVMAAGTALPLWSTSLPALAASAVLVGGTFMVATMAGLQVAREQAPADPTPLLGRLTVAFATGQIAGPLLVRLIGGATWSGLGAVDLSLALATILLVVSGIVLARMQAR